jgi:ankyrin repeat protein
MKTLLMGLLFIISLSSFALEGKEGGNGGDDIRGKWITEYGASILNYLQIDIRGQNLVRQFNLNSKLIGETLSTKRIIVTDETLLDNGSSIVDAKVIDGVIYLNQKRWQDLFKKGDVHYLVFHEMLRSASFDDDDYRISKNIKGVDLDNTTPMNVPESKALLDEIQNYNDYYMISSILSRGASPNYRDQVNGGGISLHYAVTQNYVGKYNISKIIKALLNHGAFINTQNGNGNTPLFLAVRSDSKEAVRTLLEAGASPFINNNGNNAPIDIAYRNDVSPNIIQALIDAGAIKDNPTPMIWAGRNRSKNGVSVLIKNGFSINQREAGIYGYDHLKRSIIFPFAVIDSFEPSLKESLDFLNFLLEQEGIDLNLQDTEGKTAVDHYILEYPKRYFPKLILRLIEQGATLEPKRSPNLLNEAIKKASGANEDSLKVIEHLIRAGYSVNDQINNTITEAVKRLDVKLVELLIKNNISLTFIDSNGNNLLSLIEPVRSGSEASSLMFKLLLEAGVNVNHINPITKEPFNHKFVTLEPYQSSKELLKLFKQFGLNPNLVNKDGANFLLKSIKSNYGNGNNTLWMLNEVLFDLVDVNQQDIKGQTALHYLIDMPFTSSIVELLKKILSMKADPNIKNEFGNTSLLLAAKSPQNGRFDIINTLLDFGANPLIANLEGESLFSMMKKNKKAFPKELYQRVKQVIRDNDK